MKMVVAARSLKGTWSPGKHWGPKPVVVDVDEELAKFFAENPDQFVLFPLEKPKDK